jgi:hypothetical protein
MPLNVVVSENVVAVTGLGPEMGVPVVETGEVVER